MIGLIKKWLYGNEVGDDDLPAPSQVASAIRPKPRPAPLQVRPPQNAPRVDAPHVQPNLEGHVETAGPDKNVLIRNRYLREDTGTHETLKILDDSLVDSGEAAGIDPYNTGNFDRSKNWDKRDR